MARHEISDKQWRKLESILDSSRPGPKPKIGHRQFINAVLYRAKTGIPWRDLPDRYGPWKSVYNRFNNWSKAGIWELLFAALSIELDDEDEEGSIVDATIVRAHLDAAGEKGGSKQMLWDSLAEAFQRRSTP